MEPNGNKESSLSQTRWRFLVWFDNWIDRIQQFIMQHVYPYLRRKDAGYVANVLAEYSRVRVDPKRLSKLPNEDEVEQCYRLLCTPVDALVDGSFLSDARTESSAEQDSPASDQLPSNNYASKVWLQNYMRQIFIVETAVIELQDFPTLIARTPLLLARYSKTAGAASEPIQKAYAPYVTEEQLQLQLRKWEEAPVDAREKIETPLRSRLQILLNDVHWWYAQSQVREELFLGQQIAVIVTFILTSVVLAIVYQRMCGNCSNSAVVLAMFFGMLGAFTSIMRRMRNDAEQHGGGTESSYKELTALAYGKVGIVFGLFFGIIFSLVMMLLFNSGLTGVVFSAALFPTLPLQCAASACQTGQTCLFGLLPESASQFGKLMLWAFVSGFAETLVPDALDRLTRAADAPKAK